MLLLSFMWWINLFSFGSRVTHTLLAFCCGIGRSLVFYGLFYKKMPPEKHVGAGIYCLNLVVYIGKLLTKCFLELLLNCNVVNSPQTAGSQGIYRLLLFLWLVEVISIHWVPRACLAWKRNRIISLFLPCELDVALAKWGRRKERIHFCKIGFFFS